MKQIKLINLYIAKNFLIKFLQVVLGFSLMIFFVNFLDAIDKSREAEVPFYAIISMAFLQIPNFLNDIVPSLVLIAAIITFFLLSSKSEITIIRMSGFSLWQILRPIAISAMLIGIFWVTIFGPVSIKMVEKFNTLEGKYILNELREVVAPRNGIWLKQANKEDSDEELIIQAKKVYKENLELNKVTIWFFDRDNQFYKKIDADKMLLKDNYWLLSDVIINDHETLNKKLDNLSIPTNLKADFVMQKIVNNFQNEKLFSIFKLPNLIKDLRSAGFASTKFKVYFHLLINRPFLFLAMTLIACYFGLNHIRDRNGALMIFLGIILGLVLYIITSIMNTLGSSGIIPIFASTWLITLICLAIGTLLIYQKENL